MRGHFLRHMLAVALGAMLLVGCIGPREMLARHQAACRVYGFTPGTKDYANCLMYLDAGDHGFSHHGGRLADRAPRHPAPSADGAISEPTPAEPRRS